jgi:hypothetical protein
VLNASVAVAAVRPSELEEPQGGDGHPVVPQHTRPVVGDQREQLAGGGNCLVGDRGNAVEEEIEPALPVPSAANRAKAPVVVIAMPFEEEAEVEQRLRQQLPVLEQ